MWAVAVHDLGLTDSEFWDASIWQISALADRYMLGERRLDARAALVASVIANANRDPKKKLDPFTVDDFMPNPAKKKQAQSWQAMHAQLLNWRAGFKANDKAVSNPRVDKASSIVRRKRG